MVEIRLHGNLAQDFGKVWNLDIQTVQEAVQAIEANMAGFRRRIMELSNKGMVFRVRAKGHDYDSNDVHVSLGHVERIDIIPMVVGASAGVRFVVGAALLAVAYFFPVTAPYLVPMGLSLMLGSVVEWLTPKVSHDGSAAGLQSWTISGPTNTVDQGLPVPVIYGEVLTGGYAISGGISVSQFVNGTVGPSVSIGGITSVSDRTGASGNFTSKVKLEVGTFSMKEPFTYSWTQTGFSGASAVRLVGNTTAALTLEVDFVGITIDTVTTYTGTVSVTVTGLSVDNSGSSVSASASTAVSVSIDSTAYQAPGFAGDTGGAGGSTGSSGDGGSAGAGGGSGE